MSSVVNQHSEFSVKNHNDYRVCFLLWGVGI